MPPVFYVTAPSGTIKVSQEGDADATFTVSNSSERPRRSLAKVAPLENAKSEWFTVVGDPERDIPVQGTTQYTVRLAIPAGTPEGSYKFRLDVVSAVRDEDDRTEGPTVIFEVPKTKKPPNLLPFIIGGAVLLLLIIGGVAWYLLQKKVPSLVGKTLAAAQQELVEEELVAAPSSTYDSTAVDSTVTAQSPKAGSFCKKGDTIQLTFNQKTVVVPDVLNKDWNTAMATLLQADLYPLFASVSSGQTVNTVVSTSPAIGETVPKLSYINVNLAAAPTPTPGGGPIIDWDRFRRFRVNPDVQRQINESIRRAAIRERVGRGGVVIP